MQVTDWQEDFDVCDCSSGSVQGLCDCFLFKNCVCGSFFDVEVFRFDLYLDFGVKVLNEFFLFVVELRFIVWWMFVFRIFFHKS